MWEIYEMAPITPRGNIHAPVWVIIEQPYEQDKTKGYVFSEGYGYVFDKMMNEAGLPDYYVLPRVADFDHRDTYTIVESALNQFRPPIVIPLGNSLGFFCPDTKKYQVKKNKNVDEQDADLEKYAGSLLTSDRLLNYPHYILSTLPPDVIVRKWDQRDICVNLDLGKAKSELDFYRKNGYLEPLPERKLIYDFDEPGGFQRLLEYLDEYKKANLLSVDIESIYTLKSSKYWPHPGVPITVGMAASSKEGISFRLFRESKTETMLLWRRLDDVLSNTSILGQNFFDFDCTRLNSLGFSIPYSSISDTLIRHHILWPELPHKLQFQTRQYTREPYYKDEGKQWSLKDLKSLMRYNCLDVCVTMEIFEKQEEEFNERSYLR